MHVFYLSFYYKAGGLVGEGQPHVRLARDGATKGPIDMHTREAGQLKGEVPPKADKGHLHSCTDACISRPTLFAFFCLNSLLQISHNRRSQPRSAMLSPTSSTRVPRPPSPPSETHSVQRSAVAFPCTRSSCLLSWPFETLYRPPPPALRRPLPTPSPLPAKENLQRPARLTPLCTGGNAVPQPPACALSCTLTRHARSPLASRPLEKRCRLSRSLGWWCVLSCVFRVLARYSSSFRPPRHCTRESAQSIPRCSMLCLISVLRPRLRDLTHAFHSSTSLFGDAISIPMQHSRKKVNSALLVTPCDRLYTPTKVVWNTQLDRVGSVDETPRKAPVLDPPNTSVEIDPIRVIQ